MFACRELGYKGVVCSPLDIVSALVLMKHWKAHVSCRGASWSEVSGIIGLEDWPDMTVVSVCAGTLSAVFLDWVNLRCRCKETEYQSARIRCVIKCKGSKAIQAIVCVC